MTPKIKHHVNEQVTLKELLKELKYKGHTLKAIRTGYGAAWLDYDEETE